MPTHVVGALQIQTTFQDGLVSDAGGLSVDVQSFHYNIAGTIGKFNGALNQSLTDNTENYLYVGSGGALQISTSGYPTGGDHVRLAKVATNTGVIVNIDDQRSWLAGVPVGGGGGETNTASNVGTGTGLYKQKVGVNLEFKSLKAASTKITIGSGTSEVTVDVAEANIVHQNINGHGTQTHAQLDGHVASTSNPHSVTAAQTGALADIVADTSPQLGGDLDCNSQDIDNAVNITFASEYDNGNSGTTKTVDWNNSQKQKVTLNDNCLFTFTAPEGPCNLMLRIIRDGTAGRTVTWPASVKTPTPYSLLSTANAVNLLAFYYDGTNYWLGHNNYN